MGGRDDAAPGHGLVARHAGFGDRRQFGKHRRAPRPRYRDAAHPTRFRVCADGSDVIEHELDFAGDEVVDRRRAAAIGHMQDEGAGHRLEELAAQVPGGAIAR